MFVLDQRRQPVPINVPGELYIGGHGVGRGYLERRELTDERFVPHPFRNDAQARLYRSGDLVRWWPNGELECLGRLDHQVKIRGFRIEPGEIEKAIIDHPQVRQAIVVARDDGHGKQLVAYVVPAGDSAPRIDELQSFLQTRLPRYMLPAALVTLSEFPVTTSGKVDRRSLLAPSSERPALAQVYHAPRTELETTLVAIWQSVLGREQVGIGDNFFELGGDSILAIQVVAQARSAGLELLPRHLFERPTVAQLAEVAGQKRMILAEQGVVTGAAPLMPIARWYFQQQQPDPQHFNQALLLTSRERIDRGALERALPTLLRQHDALRMRFEPTPAGWQQEFASLDEAAIDQLIDSVDLRLNATSARAAWKTAAARAQQSLDLAAGRLVHFLIGDTGGSADRLLVVVHHLAVDGVSWRILVEDLISVYEQSRAGLAVKLPDKTSSYRDWSSRLAEYTQSDKPRAELLYWRHVVAPGVVRLPGDATAKTGTAGEAKTCLLALDSESTKRLLRETSVAQRASVEELLLAALSRALGQWVPEGAVLVDLEGHGREELFDDLDVSRTVGWFTTMYPVRLNLNAQRLPVDLLADVKDLLRAVPQRGLGFGLLRYLAGATELAETPTAEISFNYLGQLDTAIGTQTGWNWSLEGTGPTRSPAQHRSHALVVSAAIVGGRLQASFEFNPKRHRPEVVERFGAYFLHALEALLAAAPAVDAQATSDAGAICENQSAAAKSDGAGATSVLVPIRTTGDRPPLFCDRRHSVFVLRSGSPPRASATVLRDSGPWARRWYTDRDHRGARQRVLHGDEECTADGPLLPGRLVARWIRGLRNGAAVLASRG
jgi:non-ribosomal peptide synthase protein (TIGR01720 family)